MTFSLACALRPLRKVRRRILRIWTEAAWDREGTIHGRVPCVYCGELMHPGKITVDHLEPTAVAYDSPVVPACWSCNVDQKRSQPLAVFLATFTPEQQLLVLARIETWKIVRVDTPLEAVVRVDDGERLCRIRGGIYKYETEEARRARLRALDHELGWTGRLTEGER